MINTPPTITITFVQGSGTSLQMMSHVSKGLFLPGGRWDVDPEISVQHRVISAERSWEQSLFFFFFWQREGFGIRSAWN